MLFRDIYLFVINIIVVKAYIKESIYKSLIFSYVGRLTIPHFPEVTMPQLAEKLYLWAVNFPLVSEVRWQVPYLRFGFWAGSS